MGKDDVWPSLNKGVERFGTIYNSAQENADYAIVQAFIGLPRMMFAPGYWSLHLKSAALDWRLRTPLKSLDPGVIAQDEADVIARLLHCRWFADLDVAIMATLHQYDLGWGWKHDLQS